MPNLWGGRFKKELDEDAIALSYSFAFDKNLLVYDVKTNLAHATGLFKKGYLTKAELSQITECLSEIQHQFETGDQSILGADEDVHSCVERLVTERLGDIGKKLHTGKSRNDQVATDMRLYIKDQTTMVVDLLASLIKTLIQLASQHEKTIFPGLTHFQTAQPVLLAHHLLAHVERFVRDRNRFLDSLDRTDVCPLGGGALSGNNYGLDRKEMARSLGFSKITQNSMDAVSDRDFVAEFLFCTSLMMTHLSQFCEELVLWSSPLIGFVKIGDSFTTGSSLMPQKKNPDMAELIRGKTGRVNGALLGLLTTLKSLPLTYNRDLQEDKEGVFDTVETVMLSLRCFTKMLETLDFQIDEIQEALSKGHILATEIADYLVSKKIPFRKAHDLTGQIVLAAESKGLALHELALDDFREIEPQIDSDIYEWLTLESAIQKKSSIGGTSYDQVKKQIIALKKQFK